ncbi:hypothetical protein ACFYQA_19545 [Streptomyces sp. NPDC005774]|uniref:hypothetical protein n=1 Tax=Streptomyces sp. NPDC005774 TaxID=3364728 RepID=UPI0036B544A6
MEGLVVFTRAASASSPPRPAPARPTMLGSATSPRPCRPGVDRLFTARDQGAAAQQLQPIAAEGPSEMYFLRRAIHLIGIDRCFRFLAVLPV